jgi:hypothetical protein
VQDDSFAFIENLPPVWKRVVGVLLAIFAGLFYGTSLSLDCRSRARLP